MLVMYFLYNDTYYIICVLIFTTILQALWGQRILFFEFLAPYQVHDSLRTLSTCLCKEWTKMPLWIDETPMKWGEREKERRETWNKPLEIPTNYVLYCILLHLSVLFIFRSRAIADFLLSQNHFKMDGIVLNTHTVCSVNICDWLIILGTPLRYCSVSWLRNV